MRIVHVTTRTQLNECLDIRREVFVREQAVPEQLEVDEYDAFPLVCDHVLLYDDTIAVGTGRMREFDEDVAKLQRIAVKQAYRGRGFGKALLLGLEELARARGYAYALLDAQCSAEPFYTRCGYRSISDEPFEDAGIWHVRMKKAL